MQKGNEILRTVLRAILFTGMFAVAASSPYFIRRVFPILLKHAAHKLKTRKGGEKKFYNAFYYLKKKGMVETSYKGKQLYISLTEKGKELAQKYQIDDLKIKRPDKWDKKWRILIFDVPHEDRLKREALRGKLKELGFYKLQKSVWVYPYEFKDEVEILRNFFGFDSEEMKIIVASEIENDRSLKSFFRLK